MTDEQAAAGVEGFSMVHCWQALAPHEQDDLVAFWLREGALPGEPHARERLTQVVAYARSSEGEIAGVCTAYPGTVPALGQPMYHYRSFVGKRWRHTLLVMRLLRTAEKVLHAYAQAHGFPAIGIVAELENPWFASVQARRPVWRLGGDFHMTYIGKSARGFDLRVHYFRNARLIRA
ncbi:hypothetical protein OS187_12240 [Xanthomonadaceae bacterium JHOS43]|nr:hypothetical protein [Xanthomonadaceae bacterium JHOS43]MCX7564452.1 hypothetical protein [Xanthomonadaceae bacterium XH05]